MDPLAMLVVLFIGMSVVSVLALLMMVLMKDEKKKKYAVFFLGIWGMLIACMNVSSLPSNFIGEIVRALILGAMAAIALLIQICARTKAHSIAARILVTVSVVAGLISLFLL